MMTNGRGLRLVWALVVIALAAAVALPVQAQEPPPYVDDNGGFYCTQELFDQGVCTQIDAYYCWPGTGCSGPPSTTTTTVVDTEPPFAPSVDASNEADQVTLEIGTEDEAQVQVSLEDGTIIATGTADGTGNLALVFTLSAGSHDLSVIAIDKAGNVSEPTVVTVDVEGPPPDAPEVDVTPGSPEDNRTRFRITGEPTSSFEVQASSPDHETIDKSGTLDGEGSAAADLLLANGSWTYEVTLSNGVGDSDPTSGEIEIEIGPPPPPELVVVSDPGSTPVRIEVTGPVRGAVSATASNEELSTEIRSEDELDEDGIGELEFDIAEDGSWDIAAVATDFQDQESEPGSLSDVVVDRQGPTLNLERISAAKDEFGYKVITEVGAEVEIVSDTEALNTRFTAEEEETEMRVKVAKGKHTITATATDPYGNDTIDSLTVDVGAGGGLPVLPIILGVIVVAFGVFGFVKRTEIRDWWYNRQYH